jgi:serine protease AprX
VSEGGAQPLAGRGGARGGAAQAGARRRAARARRGGARQSDGARARAVYCQKALDALESAHLEATAAKDEQHARTLAAVEAAGAGVASAQLEAARRRRGGGISSRPMHHASPDLRRILPISERLHADPSCAGRGVTIAFLDSGFYAHADLTTPRNRIRAYHDLFTPGASLAALETPDASSWHGMMTSVVAAGNGALSEGRFRGLAWDADVVLVKVGSAHRILHDDIRKGVEWVIEHREKYNIRVLNISCGGDYEESYLTDHLSRAADDATRHGIVVVAAAGNSGHDPAHHVLPPASAPSVIAVGGLDDGGAGERNWHYHSSYGLTVDGLQKPEIIAPAIWVAAPILPGTSTAAQAQLLSLLDAAEDEELPGLLVQHAGVDPDLDAIAGREGYLVRQLAAAKLHDQKVLSGNYKHVDGTSFAAPIVSSVVAQMLEANPRLRPQQCRRILMQTARGLPGIPLERQGWGVVQPRAAVAAARAA